MGCVAVRLNNKVALQFIRVRALDEAVKVGRERGSRKAMLAWVISGYVAVGSVWPNILFAGLDDFFANLGGGGGYAWMIGAALGAIIHMAISGRGK